MLCCIAIRKAHDIDRLSSEARADLVVELEVSAVALDNGGLLEGPPGSRAQQLPGGVLQWPAAPLLQLVLALPEHLAHLCGYAPGIILPAQPVSCCISGMLLHVLLLCSLSKACLWSVVHSRL